jgi:tape measure domain-containing protein
MADFRIRVIVDPSSSVQGLRTVEQGLSRIESQAGRLGTLLGQVLGFVGIASGVRELARMADVMTNMENRIRLVTDSTAELNTVTSRLFDISARTRVGFESTATIYARTALSVKNLGLSQQETLNFTESLNQAMVLSGVTAQEANAGLIQLSQGLASNRLGGDELRSVLEQLPVVADVIATRLGVTRGELRKLGSEGKISAETIISAFKNAASELKDSFGDTIPTISQSFSVLQTRVIQYIAKVDDSTGASEGLARAIITLSDNLDIVGRSFAIVGAVIIGYFVGEALFKLEVALRALWVLILANPLLALVAVIGTAVVALIGFSDMIKVSSEGIATLEDVGVVVFENIKSSIQSVIGVFSTFTASFTGVADDILSSFDPLIKGIKNIVGDVEFSLKGISLLMARAADRVVAIWLGAFAAIKAIFQRLPNIIGGTFIEAFNTISTKLETTINKVLTTLNKLDTFFGLEATELVSFDQIENTFVNGFTDVGAAAKDAFFGAADFDSVSTVVKKIFDDAEALALKNVVAPEAADLTEKGPASAPSTALFQEQIALLQQEGELLMLSNRERGIQAELLGIIKKIEDSGENVTDMQQAALETLIRHTQALREQAEVLEQIKGPREDLILQEQTLNALYQQGRISVEELTLALTDLAIAHSQLNIDEGEGSFADGFIVGLENMLEAVRNFRAEAGMEFAGFFEGMSQGFANATADAIVYGTSLKEGLGNAARSALRDLISGLIKLGIQYVLNAALATTLGTAATVAGAAQATTLATAWATPAALASLASFGANGIPAAAAITSTVGLAQGLAIGGAIGLADGGEVRGAGGPRSDSIPAMLSNGEFVVNAKAASRFKPLLEQINSNRAFRDGGEVAREGDTASAIQGSGSNGSSSTRIINVLDPALLGDYMSTPEGEDAIVNVIRRNSTVIRRHIAD